MLITESHVSVDYRYDNIIHCSRINSRPLSRHSWLNIYRRTVKREAAQMSLNDDFDRPFEDFEPLQWAALRELCQANAEYFMNHQDENGVRIRAALMAMLDHLEQLQPLYKEITRVAPMFDFDEQTPGNGYRSFLVLIDKCIVYSRSVCHQIYCQKDSMFFRKSYQMR